MKPIKMCPRCGEPVPTKEHAGKFPGATSRTDNETEVCSMRGEEEAMGVGPMAQREWPGKLVEEQIEYRTWREIAVAKAAREFAVRLAKAVKL